MDTDTVTDRSGCPTYNQIYLKQVITFQLTKKLQRLLFETSLVRREFVVRETSLLGILTNDVRGCHKYHTVPVGTI